MTLMMMHVNDPVPDLRKLNPDVPDDLVAVINKALAKDPNDRYQTAGQMAAALRNVIDPAKAGTSVDIPAPAATMLEELPSSAAGPDATALEQVPSAPQGTVVEPALMPSSDEVGGTVVETAAPTAASMSPAPQPGPKASAPVKKSGLPLPAIIGGVAVLAVLIIGGIFMASRGGGNETAVPTEEPVVAVVDTAVPTQTAVPEPTEVIIPTEIPTDTAIPPSPTPETPYVVITGIKLEGNSYVVDFEMHNSPPDLHVHMFFNTVPPDQAGSPGSGPWKLIGGAYGPSPFTGYGPANRPPNAT